MLTRSRPIQDLRLYLTPLATLIGLGLCAGALYRAGGARAEAHRLETANLPARILPAKARERKPTSHGLRDLFRPHVEEAAARCGLDPALRADPAIAVVELPLALVVAADGRVVEAAPAGSARVFGADGAARALDLGEARARCYAGLVREWVRFAAGEAPQRIEASLRVVDAQ